MDKERDIMTQNKYQTELSELLVRQIMAANVQKTH